MRSACVGEGHPTQITAHSYEANSHSNDTGRKSWSVVVWLECRVNTHTQSTEQWVTHQNFVDVFDRQGKNFVQAFDGRRDALNTFVWAESMSM